MYRDVAKRVLAVILTFCMIGTMPDVTLLAGVTSENERTDVSSEEGLTVNDGDSETVEEAGTEVDASLYTEEEAADSEEAVEKQDAEGTEEPKEAESTLNPQADGDEEEPEPGERVSLQSTRITKPGALPNQIRGSIVPDEGDGFVAGSILGLELKDGDTVLAQITDKASGADGYKVYAVLGSDGDSVNITVRGNGGYTGDLIYTAGFGYDLSGSTVALSYDGYPAGTTSYSYEGRPIEPAVAVTTSDGTALTANTDYTLTYVDNENAGTAHVVLQGIGRYAGTRTADFNILQSNVSSLFAIHVSGAVYNKAEAASAEGITPSEVTVTNTVTNQPADPEDYSLSYRDNTYISAPLQPAMLVVTGTGNCTGSREEPYQITAASFDDGAYAEKDKIHVELDPTYSLSYTGQRLEPPITVYQKDKQTGKLVRNTDYTAVYSDNINVGTGKITITGTGNYTGSRVVTFTIGKFNVKDIDSSLIDVTEYAYTGSEIRPVVPNSLTDTSGHPLTEGVDYDVRYANNINVGNGIIRIIGKGNCTGELDVYFVIYKDIASTDIAVDPIADQPYSGSAVYPGPVIRDNGTLLQKDRHYTLGYEPADPVDVDTYQITITGDGSYYRGTRTTEFRIVRRDMSTVEVQFTRPAANDSYTFTGSSIQPEVKVVDRESGRALPIGDFEIAYTDRSGRPSPSVAGECTVTVTPRDVNKYAGDAATLTYTITPKTLAEGRNYTVRLDGQDTVTLSYTGSALEPQVTVVDNQRNSTTGEQASSGGGYPIPESDYTVEYTNNLDAGTATVTVTGRGNYAGSISRNFRITPLNLANASAVEIYLQPDVAYPYTGDTVVPIVSELTVDGRTLRADEFTVASEAVNAGDAEHTFTVIGTGNYTGSIESNASVVTNGPVTFRITPQDIAAIDVQVEEIPNQSYTGRELRPVPAMTYNGKALTSSDYDLAYANNINLDLNTTDPEQMPTVTITGKGNFTGTRTVYFHICESIARAVVLGLDNLTYTFTSREFRPVPTSVALDGRQLERGVDYSVSYKNNIDAGNGSSENPPTVVINGMGLYGGSVEKTFTIEQVEISLNRNGVLNEPLSCVIGSSPMFTGSAARPTITLKHNVLLSDTGERFTYVLEEGKDYEFEPAQNITVGNATRYNLRIRPIGNYKTGAGYTWVPLGTYTIKPKPVASDEILVEIGEFDATHLPVVPPVRVIDTKRGVDGEYVEENGTYVLREGSGSDYVIQYRNNTAPGTASILITGRNNYNASVIRNFLIPGNLSNAQIEFLDAADPSGEYLYTGSEITPKIRVTCGRDANDRVIELRSGVDYEYRINGDNTNCGSPEIELIGKGAYEGSTRRVNFRITPRSLTDNAVKINLPGSVDYDEGRNVEPKPSIVLGRYTLVEGVDYVCGYENPCSMPSNISGKKYTVTIRAVNGGNFTGEALREYTIGNNFNVKIEFADDSDGTYTYTGNEIVPVLKVTDNNNGNELVRGRDYDMSYAPGNVNVGRVTLTVFGLGEPGNTETEYCGSRQSSFTIVGKSLGDPDIVIGDIEDYVYTSKAIMPEPQVVWSGHGADGADVELVSGQDFKYTYSANVNAGTGTVRIEPLSGTSNFSGYQEKTFTILKKNLEDEDVFIDSIPDQVYIGDAITPKLNIFWGESADSQVTLSESDYTLAYGEEGNVEVGTVEVTINGTGNYEGTIETSFRIVKVKLSDVTAEYSKEEQYTGKQITPEVKLTYQSTDNRTIEMNAPDVWGYAISYGSNQLLGTTSGSITVTADPNGNCEGDPLVLRFAIIKRHLDDSTVSMTGIEDTYTFDPNETACEPEPILTFKPDAFTTYTLRRGYDYTVSYEGNTTVNAAAKITVTGIGNFDRSLEKTFRITKNLLDYIETAAVADTPLIYNGQVQHPRVNVTFKTNDIEEGRDYELVWDEDCVNAGEHTVIIRGVGDYGGDLPLTFSIGKRDISHVAIAIDDYEFTGSEIDPVVLVSDPEISDTLFGGDVYVIKGIESNLEIGTATVTIEAVETSNYTGTTTGTFAIKPVDLTGLRITSSSIESPQQYTGNPIEPGVVITDSGRNTRGEAISEEDGESYYVLTEGTDYETDYTDNIYPGKPSAAVVITGIGHYAGTLNKEFDIQADLEMVEVEPIPVQEYTGREVHPELVVTLKEWRLTEGEDYELTWDEDCINAGDHTVVLRGLGDYTGERTLTFTIGKRDIGKAEIEVSDCEFTGSEIEPEIEVIDTELGDAPLSKDLYTVIGITDNREVGTATITITAAEDSNYTGSTTGTFEILPVDLQSSRIVSTAIETPQEYTGRPVEPGVTIADHSRGADGEAISDQNGDTFYELAEGKDYEIEYADNIYPGETPATVTITGKGSYAGTLAKVFDIQADLAMTEIAPIPSQPYTGAEVRPELTVKLGERTLRENFDYRVEYSNNIERGIATAAIYPVAGTLYTGSNQVSFIISRDIAEADIEISNSEYVYTGGEIRPEVTVTFDGMNLVLGTDYEVVYESNVNVGTATITIKGIGGYDGSVIRTFTILSRDITEAEIQLIDSEFTYTGREIVPEAAVLIDGVLLEQGVDYEIRYENNVNVGTASITVTGLGGNSGRARRTFAILKRSITRCTFGNVTDKIYTGTPTSQDLVVRDGGGITAQAAENGGTLVLNRDYTLTYENNAAPGVATLVVSGIGNYGGTKTIRYMVQFTDMTAVTASASASSITLSWAEVPGADGYGIYDANDVLIARTAGLTYVHADLDALATYTYKVRPYRTSNGTAYYGSFSNTVQAATGIAAPALKVKAGKRRAKLTWNKVKGVNGYEIYRSTKKKKSYKKIKTAKKATIVGYTNKSLTKKKKYYYRIRAYKKVNGRKVYSSYSPVKSVKVK